MIRQARLEDAENITFIYNHYIENTSTTFEIEPITVTQMIERIEECKKHDYPWLVAESNGQIIGYSYATQWKARTAYQHTVEASVYLAPESRGQGWGTKLFKELLETLKAQHIHAVIGSVALPNNPSIALLEKFGMEKVGHLKEVGRKFDQWVDVGFWQLILKD